METEKNIDIDPLKNSANVQLFSKQGIIYSSVTAKSYSEAIKEANEQNISLNGLIAEGKYITEVQIKGKHISLVNCVIAGDGLTELNLEKSTIKGSSIERMNITGLYDSLISDVTIKDSNLNGIRSEKSKYVKVVIQNISDRAPIMNVNLQGASLVNVEENNGFSHANMRKTEIRCSAITGIENSDLRQARILESTIGKFTNTDARNTTFDNSIIQSSVNGTDFSGSNAMLDEVTKSSIEDCSNENTIFKTVFEDEMKELSKHR